METLSELATKINNAHELGEQATWKGLEYFRKAGEWLIAAKAQCGHGKWLKWLAANVRFSQQTASNYMRIADDWDKLPTVGNLRDALRLLTEDEQDAENRNASDKGAAEWNVVLASNGVFDILRREFDRWPEEYREQFIASVRFHLDRLQGEIDAYRGEGADTAKAG